MSKDDIHHFPSKEGKRRPYKVFFCPLSMHTEENEAKIREKTLVAFDWLFFFLFSLVSEEGPRCSLFKNEIRKEEGVWRACCSMAWRYCYIPWRVSWKFKCKPGNGEHQKITTSGYLWLWVGVSLRCQYDNLYVNNYSTTMLLQPSPSALKYRQLELHAD